MSTSSSPTDPSTRPMSSWLSFARLACLPAFFANRFLFVSFSSLAWLEVSIVARRAGYASCMMITNNLICKVMSGLYLFVCVLIILRRHSLLCYPFFFFQKTFDSMCCARVHAARRSDDRSEKEKEKRNNKCRPGARYELLGTYVGHPGRPQAGRYQRQREAAVSLPDDCLAGIDLEERRKLVRLVLSSTTLNFSRRRRRRRRPWHPRASIGFHL